MRGILQDCLFEREVNDMNSRNESIETERSEAAQGVFESPAEGQSISEWQVFLLCSQSSPERKPVELYGPLTQGWLEQQAEKAKEQLSLLFTRFLQSLLGTERAIGALATSAGPPNHAREREALWLEHNKDVMKKFADYWVAIEGDHLIAASPDFGRVLEETRQRGIRVPFIVYVPPEIESNTLDL